MIEDLEGDKATAFWIGTSYLLVNAVTMPFTCSISDIFGRPMCFEFSLVMFALGTIVCCTAHTVTQMLAGRCIQGVGGAGIHALGLVILCDIVPLKDRPKWYGVTYVLTSSDDALVYTEVSIALVDGPSDSRWDPSLVGV